MSEGTVFAGYGTKNSYITATIPRYIWEWDVYGTGELTIRFTRNIRWSARIVTRFVLGSKWRRL